MRDVHDVVKEYSGRKRAVLDYTLTVKRLADAATDDTGSARDWAPLADLVDVDRFVRVGNFKEVMNWTEYVGFLVNWARSSQWEASFKRIAESDRVVYLELEERSRVGDFESVVNSLSIYEFTDAGRIHRIDLYLQMALPNMELLNGYEGVELSE